MRVHALVLTLVLSFISISSAPAAGLDPTFGSNGQVVLQLPGDASSQAQDAIIQHDGKIVVAGTSPGVDDIAYIGLEALDPTRDFLVTRFNPDGSLDSEFGSGGIVKIDFGNGDDRAAAVIEQADGKLLVVGQALSERGDDFDVAVARLDSHGNLDTSFNGTGKVTVNASLSSSSTSSSFYELYADNEPTVVAQQADGKLLIGSALHDLYSSPIGSSPGQLLRLLPDGTLDTSFGSNGTGIVNTLWVATAILIEPSGKILILNGGDAFELDADGQPLFDTGIQLIGNTYFDPLTCVYQPDGQAVLGGTSLQPYPYISVVTRNTSFDNPNPSDDIDRSFANGGLAANVNGGTTPASGLVSFINGLLLEPSGNILAGGVAYNSTHYDATVTRLRPDGSVDSNFGQIGVLTWSAASDTDNLSLMTVKTLRSASGKLLLVGNRGDFLGSIFLQATSKRIVIARLTSTPEYSVAQSAYNVSESGGSINIRITRSGTTSSAVSVSYTTVDGSAVAGTDYTATSGTLTWQPGDADTQTISVPIRDQSIHDGSKRQFSLQLAAPSEGSLATDTAAVSISEDDPAPAPKSGGGGSLDWLTLGALLACGAGVLKSRRRPLCRGDRRADL